jgi:hypothetical protein
LVRLRLAGLLHLFSLYEDLTHAGFKSATVLNIGELLLFSVHFDL